jgi:hypothetical protein
VRLVEQRVLVADNSFLLQMIKALDIKIRLAHQQVLTLLVDRLFEMDNMPLIEKVFDCCFLLISNNDLASNWLKID